MNEETRKNMTDKENTESQIKEEGKAQIQIFERGDRFEVSKKDIPEEERELLKDVHYLNEICKTAQDSELIKLALEDNRGLAIAIEKIAIGAKEAVDNLPMKASKIHYAWGKYKKTDNYALLKNLYLKLEIADDRVYLVTQMPQWVYVWRYVNRFKWKNESEQDAIARQGTIEMVCAIILEYKRMTELQELECEQQQTKEQYPKEYIHVEDNKEPQKKSGRPVKHFVESMINDDDGKKLRYLHQLANGKKGKDFAKIISAAILEGWITTLTFAQAKEEFGDIGSRQNYNKYIDGYTGYRKAEVTPLRTLLKNF